MERGVIGGNSIVIQFLQRIDDCRSLLQENVLKTETEKQLLRDLRQFDYEKVFNDKLDQIILLKIEKLKLMNQGIWSSQRLKGYSQCLSRHILDWEKVLKESIRTPSIKTNQKNNSKITYQSSLSQLMIGGKYISFKTAKNQKKVIELLFQDPRGLVSSEEVKREGISSLKQTCTDIKNKLRRDGVSSIDIKRFLHVFSVSGTTYCQLCFV